MLRFGMQSLRRALRFTACAVTWVAMSQPSYAEEKLTGWKDCPAIQTWLGDHGDARSQKNRDITFVRSCDHTLCTTLFVRDKSCSGVVRSDRNNVTVLGDPLVANEIASRMHLELAKANESSIALCQRMMFEAVAPMMTLAGRADHYQLPDPAFVKDHPKACNALLWMEEQRDKANAFSRSGLIQVDASTKLQRVQTKGSVELWRTRDRLNYAIYDRKRNLTTWFDSEFPSEDGDGVARLRITGYRKGIATVKSTATDRMGLTLIQTWSINFETETIEIQISAAR